MNSYHKEWVKSIANCSNEVLVYSPDGIKAIERSALGRGVCEYSLMRRAGLACWQLVMRLYPGVRSVGLVCGGGNNGGDGWVVAKLAALSGLEVRVFCTKIPATGAAALAYNSAQSESITVVESVELLNACEVIVDALIGTGLTDELRSAETAIIEAINGMNKRVVAVDVPSGLSASSGEVPSNAVEANHTITFIGLKVGLVTGQGSRYAGQVLCVGLGLGPDDISHVNPRACLVTRDFIVGHLPTRQRDAHKGLCGHVLIVGGCEHYGGAVILAAMGALQAGAGKVSVACSVVHRSALLSQLPESMWVDPDSIEDALNNVDVVVMGMGLGQGAWGKGLFAKVMACSKPLVLDADGLNVWALNPTARANTIMTPHPGEACRLLRAMRQSGKLDRLDQAKRLLSLCPDGVVVLKGSGTVIQAADHSPMIAVAGNAGMATGGMGDALAGIIGGFLGQGVSLASAAALGVYLHGWSADEMANKNGIYALTPSLLIKAVGRWHYWFSR